MNKALSRRLLGKVAAGAPFAAALGNSGLSSAGALAPSTAYPTPPIYYGQDNTTSDKAIDMAEHYRQRRAHLESVIAGKEPSTNAGEPFNGNSAFVDLHYSSLQSLSPAGRMILARREMDRRERANQVHWAKRELDSILSNWKW